MNKFLVLIVALFSVAGAQAEQTPMSLDQIQKYISEIKANGNCSLETERFQTRLERWDRLRIAIKDQTSGNSTVAILSDAQFSGTTVSIGSFEFQGKPVQVFTYRQTFLQSSFSSLTSSSTLQLYVATDKSLVGAALTNDHEERGFFRVKTVVDSQFQCQN